MTARERWLWVSVKDTTSAAASSVNATVSAARPISVAYP